MSYPVLIITGPTASGKSALAESFGLFVKSEIINADVGQFYKPLTIGTAKPDWRNSAIKHHFFDILDQPCDLSCTLYRPMAINCVKEIIDRGAQPIIVGGSLFYIRSLFYPPVGYKKLEQSVSGHAYSSIAETDDLWRKLFSIDPVRAEQLHPHDRYRIGRALDIWFQTGTLPSLYKPSYSSPFHARIVCIIPKKEVLIENIKRRTHAMFNNSSWISEASLLMKTPWESFVRQKGLIGYELIFDWVASGAKDGELCNLIQKIINHTWHYAKRQIVFLKKMVAELGAHTDEITINIIETPSVDDLR